VGTVEFTQAPDGTHVAYRVLEPDHAAGEAHDIVMVSGGLIPMHLFEAEPGFARMLDGLRGLGRLVIFDRRGLGQSDPIVEWTRPLVEQWAQDLETVIRATDACDAVVFAWDAFGVGSRFAADHPELLHSLVLMHAVPLTGDDENDWTKTRADAARENIEGRHHTFLDEIAPSRVGDDAFREWYNRAGREGASPATATRIFESVFATGSEVQRLADVMAPTLVLYRRESDYIPPMLAETTAELIPNAQLVGLDGGDFFPFSGDVDAVVAEIAAFVVGERRLPPPTRSLAAIMFTDLVGSTTRAAEIGDARWRSLIERHDDILRTVIGRNGGNVVKTTGDGVLALLPSASGALRAARQARAELARIGLELRVGIHVGDVDKRGTDVSGLAVNIAARVMSVADGQVTVTAQVAGAVAGDPIRFEMLGAHELKGVPGRWDLYGVVE
jgi:class 3 adenylate cyclase/pimeloyl-ACP methyl ester carboxylesterase